VVNEEEAATVRRIFERFTQLGSVTGLVRELRGQGVRKKRGKLVDKSYVYTLFRNRV
jgi:hypothetical protein